MTTIMTTLTTRIEKRPKGAPRGRMRRWIAAALGAVLLLGASAPLAARAADAFVEGTEDVPLMAGLAMVEGAGTVFDTPQGRIVEAYARGGVTRKAVLAFYAETLPQLGWKALGTAAYRREGETLRLELYNEKGALTVRFYLAPG